MTLNSAFELLSYVPPPLNLGLKRFKEVLNYKVQSLRISSHYKLTSVLDTTIFH